MRPLAFDEQHLSPIDGGPELLAADGADPLSDSGRVDKAVFDFGTQRPSAQQVDLDPAHRFHPLRQGLEGGLRIAHGAPRGCDQHPVPEKQRSLLGRHDFITRSLMPYPLTDVVHFTPPYV